jgi:hypothetical protein
MSTLTTNQDLADGIESLQFWRARAQRLPWYRRAARREARLMTERWERRLATAVVSQRGITLRTRGEAALLIATTRLQRLRFGRWIKVAALSVMLALAVPFLLVAALLVQIF